MVRTSIYSLQFETMALVLNFATAPYSYVLEASSFKLIDFGFNLDNESDFSLDLFSSLIAAKENLVWYIDFCIVNFWI